MTNKKRRFAIQLGEATVNKTEDLASDGDEIYVGGTLVAVSKTQGRTSRLFLRDPRSFVQFSTDPNRKPQPLPRTQQLQPRILFDQLLPADAKVMVVLEFIDADGTDDKFLGDFDDTARRIGEEFQRQVEQATDEDALRKLLLNGLVSLAGIPALKAFINLVDPDDVLGREIETFDLAGATSKVASYVASEDDASYEWGCSYLIGPVVEEPMVNVLPDPRTPIGTRDLSTEPRLPSQPTVVGDDGAVPTPTPVSPGPIAPERTVGGRTIGDRTIGDLTVTPTQVAPSGQ